MYVCVHIRFHYKNRLPDSICAQCAGKLGKQGSPWPSVLLLPPTSPSRVWRQEIGVRPQSEGHVAMVYTQMTSDLSSPPPPGLSHHSCGPQTLSPEPRTENKTSWPGPAWLGSASPSPAQETLRSEICLTQQWKTDGLWGKALEEEDSGRRKERESCKIFAKKNNPETLSNYIYLSCVVLLGRPCGLPDCSMVHFSHYLILDGEQKDEGGFGGQFGSQWEGCGEVAGLKMEMW